MVEEIVGDNDGTGWKQLKKSEETREEEIRNITVFLLTIWNLEVGSWNLNSNIRGVILAMHLFILFDKLKKSKQTHTHDIIK